MRKTRLQVLRIAVVVFRVPALEDVDVMSSLHGRTLSSKRNDVKGRESAGEKRRLAPEVDHAGSCVLS